MKTWIYLDLIAIGVLLLAWMAWRLRARRLAKSADAQTAVVRVPSVAKATGRHGQSDGTVESDDAVESAVESEDAVESDDATGSAVAAVADDAVESADADDADESAEVTLDAPAEASAPALQVIVDVAHGKGEAVLATLRPVLGIADDRVGEGGAAVEAGASGVEIQRTGDVTGPLGADRLVFETTDAPGLLTKVLTALRDCGYGIEMVVHHEVILHDVDAGVARICLAQPGRVSEIEGGMVPNSLSESPMIV